MFSIKNGDCLNLLKEIPSDSVDALVTDPPAGIKIFGHEWDSDKGGRNAWTNWMTAVMDECQRVLKPGAHALVWALPKRSHWTATAIENADFRVRDVISHAFATGFPKSMNLEKAILSTKYLDPEKIRQITMWIRERKENLKLTNRQLDSLAMTSGGACHWTNVDNPRQMTIPTPEKWQKLIPLIGPAPKHIQDLYWEMTDQQASEKEALSLKWAGWGTELKPAHEHWILAQKAPEYCNLACNLKSHGVGGLHIDASRVPTEEEIPESKSLKMGCGLWSKASERDYQYKPNPLGRFPGNLVISDSAIEEENGEGSSRIQNDLKRAAKFFKVVEADPMVWAPKPTRSEKGYSNHHPTVKSIELMRYLVKLITPAEGTVLDPFMGSGTTGVAALLSGTHFIGFEKNPEYFEIAQERLTQSKQLLGA